jgi:hypothetical protein
MRLQQSPSIPLTRRHSRGWHAAAALLLALLPYAFANDLDVSKLPPPVARDVDFVRDVQPILERTCLRCHGEEKQKSNLRLDTRKDLLHGGDDSAAIVPGNSAESLLIQLVAGLEADRVMPAKGDRLTTEQIGVLRKWIDSGAPWPDAVARIGDKRAWWSLQPLRVRSQTSEVGNPIDLFIRAKLREKGLAPSPAADPRTFCRRLYFDLIGLPPTPEEMNRFVADVIRNPTEVAAPGASGGRQTGEPIRKLTDSLLASPRYGERWARHWMDVAHFAETHGHDQDRIRENAWPYRDYLIASFNADKPYARFIQEQIAGDGLFPDDPQATVALGFLAAGPWDESSLRDIREDTIDRQIGRYLDRDDIVTTVMQTFASATVQCARCHDHKFDAISQHDYYALQAVFAATDKANRRYDADPATHLHRRELRAQLAALERGDRAVLLGAEAQREVAEFERGRAREIEWRIVTPQTFVSTGGATLSVEADGSIFASGATPERDVYTINANLPVGEITAVRLEVLADKRLPQGGPGRQQINGNLHLSEVALFAFDPGATAAHQIPLVNPSADFDQDGWTITHALDRDEKTAWGIHPREGESHHAVFELKEKLRVAGGTTLVFVLKQLHGGGHVIGKLRLATTDAPPPVTAGMPAEISAALALDAPRRTDDQRAALAAFVMREQVSRALAALPPPSLIYAGASDFEPDGNLKPALQPREVRVLKRGDILQPLELAQPAALSCVAVPFVVENGVDESARRVALARWLSHKDNPLTWRSIVNRVWHYHFGRGLVETPNDFGHMGGAPSHPELLDWLAVWFRDEAHGSLKALHRLIVTSETYQQSASAADSAEFMRNTASDPDNKLLWRHNRTRLDAESVRDAVLAISGQLDLRMGGPSDRQFDLQPGIHVTPRVDYAKFDPDSDAGRRRSVYRFLFRTLPDPMMDALDCPAGDQLTPVRNGSVTVQQALALWNSAFIGRQAGHCAVRVANEASTLEAQIVRLFALALSRSPRAEEAADFRAYIDKHGLANACRVMLNSNEFLFVE